jgi:hypothetical protein
MHEFAVNGFRTRRGQLLRKQICSLADHYGREIFVLDVGGTKKYWENVGLDGISKVDILNYNVKEFVTSSEEISLNLFNNKLGDARNLSDYADASIDLVHSNSVIEHVGGWADMRAMARELMRVGRAGWVQTPAWEFPIEPHFRAPFMHWFSHPLQIRMLSLSAKPGHRRMDIDTRHQRVEQIHLLSKSEVRALFPNRPIYVERVILAKSYTVRWMPDALPLPTHT